MASTKPVASTSKEPPSSFKGFGPPAWIFSFNEGEEGRRSGEGASTNEAQDRQRVREAMYGPSQDTGRSYKEADHEDQDASFGPTLKRRGNVKFVREGAGLGAGKGKGRAVDAEEQVDRSGGGVRGFYEALVGTSSGSVTPTSRNATPPLPIASTSSVTAAIDLTQADDTSDEEEAEMIIMNPITRLPLPPPSKLPKRKRAKPTPLHLLINPPEAKAVVPPISYAIKQTNVGYKMLERQGWKIGEGLGVAPGLTASDEVPREAEGTDGNKIRRGLLVPIKASEKFDRRGIGLDKEKGAELKRKREQLEEDRRRKREDELKSALMKGRERRALAKLEQRERKDMIAYMNRP
ncbi:hypothetical protein T439DRAFT_325273 [Meredithblackwellia eburnea MCA 4105]